MVSVIITEKPSVAKNIADALNIKNKKDGYFEGNDYIVTWAFGHLLQLYDAKDYDENMAKWRMENFPFIPSHFRYKIKSDPRHKEKEDLGAKKQLKIIYQLMKRNDVDSVIQLVIMIVKDKSLGIQLFIISTPKNKFIAYY